MSKYAIFKMSSNGWGGYNLSDAESDVFTDKEEAESLCQKMNEYTGSWYYFKVYEINEKGQALSPTMGIPILH